MTSPIPPFLPDDDARAEVEWLLARERDPSAPAPSPEVAADYAELEDLLAGLPLSALDDGWQHQVFRAAAALSSPSRRRTTAFRWVLGGTLATAAATVAWMLLPRTPQLAVAVRHTRTTRSATGEAAVGDQLVVTARPHGAGDLRVYRSDGLLAARCPNGPGCTSGSREEQTIEITLDAPLQYQVILVDGANDAPPDATVDVYLEAARAMKARITRPSPIDVH